MPTKPAAVASRFRLKVGFWSIAELLAVRDRIFSWFLHFFTYDSDC